MTRATEFFTDADFAALLRAQAVDSSSADSSESAAASPSPPQKARSRVSGKKGVKADDSADDAGDQSAPAPHKKRSRPEPDWGKFNYLIENFALIYGTDQVWDDVVRTRMSIGAMGHAHGNDMVRMWKSSPKRRVVLQENVVFDPTLKADPFECINLYDGMGMQPLPAKDKDVQCMLDLLRHLCGNCATDKMTVDEVMHWVLCWLAYPLQKPGAKLATALVFHGPQGTGKNLLFDAVKAVYGKYGVMVGQNELEEKYNTWLSARLFVIADEVMSRQELYHNKNKLKWIITAETIPIRAMNEDTRWEQNHANLVFLSNESMPLVLEERDRRYLVVYTPLADESDLYRRVTHFLAHDGPAKLYDYLLRYDVGDFFEHTKPLMTEAKRDLIELSLRPSERFIWEWINGYLPLPLRVCSAEQLYRAYRRWSELAGEKFYSSQAQFSAMATRYAKEHVEQDPATGKRMAPRLVLTSFQVPNPEKANGREFVRCWVPRGCGKVDPMQSSGAWADSCIQTFEPSLNKFYYHNRAVGTTGDGGPQDKGGMQ